MSEQAAMTVEQALALVGACSASGFTYSSWHAAAIVLADGVERLQARVAELEDQVKFISSLHMAEEEISNKFKQERDELRRRVAELIHYPDCWDTVAYPELKNALDNIDADYQGCTVCAEKSMRRIKAEAIRAAAEEYEREYCGQGVVALLLDYANQIEGGACHNCRGIYPECGWCHLCNGSGVNKC